MPINISIQAQRKGELYSELSEILKHELIKAGLSEELASKKSNDITYKIYDNWRGLHIFFPVNPIAYMENLKKKILHEFNGRNATDIVRKYRVSELTLYKWNREKLKAKKPT